MRRPLPPLFAGPVASRVGGQRLSGRIPDAIHGAPGTADVGRAAPGGVGESVQPQADEGRAFSGAGGIEDRARPEFISNLVARTGSGVDRAAEHVATWFVL